MDAGESVFGNILSRIGLRWYHYLVILGLTFWNGGFDAPAMTAGLFTGAFVAVWLITHLYRYGSRSVRRLIASDA